MAESFWIAYAVKLGIVALVLVGLYTLGRKLREARFPMPRRERCLRVLEATMLSQGSAVYVLRAGTRYFLLGSTSAGVSTLAELEESDLTSRASP